MAKLDKAITLARLSSALLKVKSYVDGVVAELASNVSGIVEDIASSLDTLETQMKDKAESGHTHNYAGSSSAGGAANSANKLNTNAGSSTKPVYFVDGIPKACSRDVPIVYKAQECTTFTSDDGTCTPAAVKKAVGMFEPKAHTHNYAGSSSAGGAATSANKLNTDAGSATQPVFFQNGVPVKTTYTLGASVPSDAKFTDTVYTHPSHTAKSSGLYKIVVDALGHVTGATAVTKSDITALGIPAQDTKYTHPAYTAKSSGLYKITVDATGHVSAVSAVAKSDITALGIAASDHTHTDIKSKDWGKISVPLSGWSSTATNGWFTNQVTVSGMTADSYPAVNVEYTSADSVDSEAAAFAVVKEIETFAGYIILRAKEKPSIDFNIRLIGA